MVTVKRRAFFMDAGYTVRNGKTYITLILKGKKTVKLYFQRDPYFIVDGPVERKDEFLDAQGMRKTGEMVSPLRVEECECRVGLGKKKMLRLYCREPSDVPALKAAMPFPCYEYNIPFVKRFVYDMQLTPLHVVAYEREGRLIKRFISVKQGEPKLEQMGFDIETYNPAGAPREGKDPVIMISWCGRKKGVITTKKAGAEYVDVVADEKSMLERFSAVVKAEDPDVLAGYNSSNFDLPYLKARAQATGASLDLGRFGSSITPLKKGLINGMRLNGRVHMDLYPIVKFFGFIGIIKTQKFTLDDVASDVLGRKKVKVKKEDIWQMWDSGDIEKLCEYSLVDSELAQALGGRVLPIEMELSSVAKMTLFETALSTSGQLVENLLMYHAVERKELIPSKPMGEAINERINAPIQGAFVKLPEPGIYENVAVLDFRGLYPSIIVSYNIDPGTLIDEKKHGAEHRNESDVFASPTGAKFSRKAVGLIPVGARPAHRHEDGAQERAEDAGQVKRRIREHQRAIRRR